MKLWHFKTILTDDFSEKKPYLLTRLASETINSNR